MELILKRVLFTNDGVIGVLINGNRPVCLTLEREWKDNEKGLSCIPEGRYLCQRVDTPKHGITYQVLQVPNRNAILFHSGNTEADSQGCILVGQVFGELEADDPATGQNEKQLAVLNSKAAFDDFMAVMEGRSTFALTIKNC